MSSDKEALESVSCETFEPDSSSISCKDNVQLVVEKKDEPQPSENTIAGNDIKTEQTRK